MVPKVVLMIDDDPDSFDRVRRYLDRDMFSLDYVADPFQGVDKAKQIDPDIIILDIRMRDLDGYEVCRRLRNHTITRHIPIIIYSVLGDEDDAYIHGLNLGAYAVVSKGKLSRLSATIERFANSEYVDGGEQPRIRTFRRQGHELRVQGDAERVWLDGEERVLRPKTRKLLACLVSRPGVLISSEELVQEVYEVEQRFRRGPEDIHRLVHDLRIEVEPVPSHPLFVENVRRYRLPIGQWG